MSEVVQTSQEPTLLERLRGPRFREQIEQALPPSVPVNRFVSVAITATMQNQALEHADLRSLYLAFIQAAQDGLLPDGREAAIVTFRNRRANKVEAVYMPMIGGYRKIAAEFGWLIDTQCVYQGDTFSYTLGLTPTLTHQPPLLDVERGELLGAYAACSDITGRTHIEVMSNHDLRRVRASSRAADDGPWVDWPDRMAEKSVGKRAFAKLPLAYADERIKRVLAADEPDDPSDPDVPLLDNPGRAAQPDEADAPQPPAPASGPGIATAAARAAQLSQLLNDVVQVRPVPPDLALEDETVVGFEAGEWPDYLRQWSAREFGVEDSAQLTDEQFGELLDYLRSFDIPF